MRAAGALFALTCAAGCGAEAERLWARPPPETPGAEAVVFALEVDGDRALFAAPAVDGRPVEPVSFEVDAAAADADGLLAFAYAPDLDALGLPAGRLAPGLGRSCRLEAPVAAFRVPLPSDGSVWAPRAATLPTRVRDTLFGGQACTLDGDCIDFASTRIPVPDATQMRAMIPHGDGVLLMDAAGRYYTVTATGATRRRDLETLPTHCLARAANGEIWFGGDDGALVRGPLGGPYVDLRVDTATSATVIGVADSADHGQLALTLAPRKDGPGQIVQVHLRRDGAWARLYEGLTERGFWWESDVAWSPNGMAVIVYGGFRVLRYDGERVHELDVRGLDLFDQVASSATILPDGQAFVGGQRGALFSSSPPYTTWTPIDVQPFAGLVQALVPYRDGLVVGGTDGLVGQYAPELPECPGLSYHEAGSHLLARVGDAVYVAGGGANNVGAGYVILLRPSDE